MDLDIHKSAVISGKSLKISGSKSETNRLLLLQALYPTIFLENTSNSDDSEVMIKALVQNPKPNRSSSVQNPEPEIIDVHHAGTAMRFLTAYFATQENRAVILTGSQRMKERPIKILVDALREFGAKIQYLENEGFPPIKITGSKITKNQVSLKADVSSQYISALLLIAPKLENGIELSLEGKITSLPYIQMTLSLLNSFGLKTSFQENVILIPPQFKIQKPEFTIESDWSSASYYYSIIALSEIGTEITLSSFKQNSFQGDSALIEIYENFGVKTVFDDNAIILKKIEIRNPKSEILNLNSSPDIAQTIAVTCFGLGIACHLTGLHTLKIKETDRLEALKNELSKLGAEITVTNDSLTLEASSLINPNIKIATYNDHRMAMAFAPLALKVPIVIENAEVVSKSYPAFWDDLRSIGFII